MKITAKFRDMEHLRFEDTKRIMSPEKFRDFRETGRSSWVLKKREKNSNYPKSNLEKTATTQRPKR